MINESSVMFFILIRLRLPAVSGVTCRSPIVEGQFLSKVWTMMNDENYNEWRIPGDGEMVENKWCLKQEKILAKRSLGFHEQSDKIVPAATQPSFKDTIETVMNWERLSELSSSKLLSLRSFVLDRPTFKILETIHQSQEGIQEWFVTWKKPLEYEDGWY